MKRVVITGMGAVTPVGKSIDEIWNNIKSGKHGFDFIKSFDTSRLDVKIAAEINDFDPTEFGISKKEARRMDRYTQFSLAASIRAVEDCGTKFEDLDPYRIGVIIGSGIGGLHTIVDEHEKYLQKGPDRVSVFFVPMMIANMAAGTVAMQFGFKGANYATVTACASSNHALGEAFRLIKYGYLDAAVAGGAESTIEEFSMAGFNNMKALSHSTDPDRASIPFDADRDGFVMGEGAGSLILEEYEHAKARGAKIYAEVVGYGATGDAYHITSPDPEGDGAAHAMMFAIEEAGIDASDIDYINAHGTSTPLNDDFETKAIKRALGDENAKKVMISSTKSMTGHLLGAAGAVEAIISAKAVQESVAPPTIGFKNADEKCDLDYVFNSAREKDIEYALSNSLGFGGHNATICLKKYRG